MAIRRDSSEQARTDLETQRAVHVRKRRTQSQHLALGIRRYVGKRFHSWDAQIIFLHGEQAERIRAQGLQRRRGGGKGERRPFAYR